MTKVTIIFVAVICLITLGFMSMISQPAQAGDAVTLPTWEEGDSWSMGFYEEFDEDSLMSTDDFDSELSMFTQFGTFDIEGSIGFYQTLTVLDVDDMTTGIECYKVEFEQYYAAVAEIDVGIHVDENDIPELSGVEGIEFKIDLDLSGYFWFQMDTDGIIYFTVDELAIAREDINVEANADIDFYGFMNYVMNEGSSGGSSEEVYYGTEDDVYYEEDDYYEEDYDSYEDSLFPEEVEIDIKVTVEDLVLAYVVEYEAPLDIFDFPIYPEESWSASSDATITLNELDGTISYDMAGNIPDSDFEPSSGTENLGEGLSLPDTYGPEYVYYKFFNAGLGSVGEYDDCIMIMSEDAYYDHYYDNYYRRGGETGSGSASGSDSEYNVQSQEYESDEPWDIVDEFDDFDAESLSEFNPLNMFLLSTNYFSPEAGMVVSSDVSESQESMPFDLSDGPASLLGDTDEMADMQMEPVTKADVENFKTIQRGEMEEQYEDYREAAAGDETESNVLLWVILIVVVVVVLLVVAMMVSKSKKGQVPPSYQQPPMQEHQSAPPPQPGYDQPPDRNVPPPPPQPGTYPPPPPPPPNY
jgi:hypothetical protein